MCGNNGPHGNTPKPGRDNEAENSVQEIEDKISFKKRNTKKGEPPKKTTAGVTRDCADEGSKGSRVTPQNSR